MKLGDLIDTLKALPATYDVKFDSGAVPQKFCSWRGVYAELTLDSSLGDKQRMTVGELLKRARKADGATFHGYKGGDYVMGRHTPVWADDYGEYLCRGLMGVRISDGTVILETADLSDYR